MKLALKIQRQLGDWLAGLLLASALPLSLAAAPSDSVRVIRVLDGDTVIVEGRKEHIRLANIDAPESSHGHRKADQPYSKASGDFLGKRVINVAGVTMACLDRDRYGRDVCELLKDGRSVNRELVQAGLAWANTSSRGRYLHDSSLVGLQQAAWNFRSGLWAEDSVNSPAISPWEWRDACCRQGICLVPGQKTSSTEPPLLPESYAGTQKRGGLRRKDSACFDLAFNG